jgi:FTR1 family protein
MSLATAIALEMWQVNQEAFEGVLLLTSAVFVVTVIVWMNRTARHLRKDIEARVETYSSRAGTAAGLGLGLFVFLMVLREGAELALILRAVGLSGQGVGIWIGTLLGLGGAVAVGVLFFRGTLKIPLGRFFAVTSWILVIVAIQLAITGVHELGESGWLPVGPREMAIIGPVVRNDFFFFVAILGVASLLVLREWLAARTAALSSASSDAERARLLRERQREARWMVAAGATFVVVTLMLVADSLYTQVSAAPAAMRTLPAEGGLVRVPTEGLGDGNVHFFQAEVEGSLQSFMVMQKPDGHWVTAIAGCLICGREGYRQEGSDVICRNCGAVIPLSTMGEVGGCNPIAVPSRLEGRELLVQASDLAQPIVVPE